MGDAREDLLARLVDEAAAHGLADRSLRELATAVGSSHRMLLYHFGSREGLVAAIVGEVEARQRQVLAGTAASMAPDGAHGDPAAIARRSWQQIGDPALRPLVQLFFEAVAYSSRSGGGGFTTPWLAEAERVAAESGIAADAVEIRLAIAVMRGLLVDVITGDDPAAADAAFERFLTMWTAAPPAPARRVR